MAPFSGQRNEPLSLRTVPSFKTSTKTFSKKKRIITRPLTLVKTKCPKSELVTAPYPTFNFRHKFSLLVVGPTQSGKTCFVQQMLENDRIEFKEKKKRRISWCSIFYRLSEDMHNT